MKRIDIELGARGYPVHVGNGMLADPAWLQAEVGSARCLVVTDDNVGPLYADACKCLPGFAGVHVIQHGEANKNMESWQAILDAMFAHQLDRESTLIALGGGVVGDLAGFAAACFMRGIRLVQIPTSLLAQVDAAVGGKTAINHSAGKNLVGAFHQPAAVIVDLQLLRSLDERNYLAGFSEIVKMALLDTPTRLENLARDSATFLARDLGLLEELVTFCCQAKAKFVVADERESGKRAFLNLGHSFAHALEKLGGYERWLHGEAVSIGLVAALRLSSELLGLDEEIPSTVARLLDACGLPVAIPDDLASSSVADAMLGDKKTSTGAPRLVLLRAVGEAELSAPVSRQQLVDWIESCRRDTVVVQ